jgi:hypothetical protein
MSTRELKRAGVLARVAARTLKLGSAAALLDVSYRQAKRLYRRYRAEGAEYWGDHIGGLPRRQPPTRTSTWRSRVGRHWT